MPTVECFKEKYYKKLDSIDLNILISHVIKKERELILIHPEYKLTTLQAKKITLLVNRRLKNEPLAYILGEKEFYGLNFKINRHTLIPRPETELMVELALQDVISHQSSVINVIDVGTGSGNIIISLAHQLKNTSYKLQATSYFATDISKEALEIAKQNAKLNKLNNIRFIHGDLLNPLIQNSKFMIHNSNILILANLPYLSKDIYNTCGDNVKKYEPKTALYSANHGLAHYDQLLNQILRLRNNYSVLCTKAKLFRVTCLMEISPEQKKIITPLIKSYFPQAQIKFKKDLAQKWRLCKVEIEG